MLTAGLTPLTPGYSKVRGTEGGEPGRAGGQWDTPQEKACSSTEASPPLSGPWKDPRLWRPGAGRPPQHGRARTRSWVTPRGPRSAQGRPCRQDGRLRSGAAPPLPDHRDEQPRGVLALAHGAPVAARRLACRHLAPPLKHRAASPAGTAQPIRREEASSCGAASQ